MKDLKRVLSCLLILLMLINNIGFYGFLVLMKERITATTVQKIRTNLNEPGGSLIVKVPLSLPYFEGTGEYEPAHGSFTFEGNVFQTIKRKFYNDTLYLVCIHDSRATEAGHQIQDLARSLASDDQETAAGKLEVSIAKYFVSDPHRFQHTRDGQFLRNNYAEYRVGTARGTPAAVFHPPRLTA